MCSPSVEESVTNHQNSNIKEAVANKTETIQQERFETQNIIIVRYYQISRLDHLYNTAEREDKEDRLAEAEGRVNGLLADGTSQLALEASPDYSQSYAL